MKRFALATLALFLSIGIQAQSLTQTVRGSVFDAESKFPLNGVAVQIGDASMQSDEEGLFTFTNIPIGRQTVQFQIIGFEPQSKSLTLNSAKEGILHIGLVEAATEIGMVDVRAGKRGEAQNEMATVSARQFSVEETNLYAGSRGEPARMATNFAGVQGSDDQRNDLVIRGNTPAGLLYRMEGINIPNPNHFAIPGTGGGPLTILNNKFLSNSDFFTGAWPAQYGNAISGVFDLNMRDGNNQSFEGSAQLGLLGTELLLEGPLGKGPQAPSFLGVYRYSTFSVFKALNIDLGTNAIPEYQDGAFRLTFPLANNGKLALWTMFGVSDINILISEDVEVSEGFESYGMTDRDQYFGSDMIVSGLSYSRPLDASTFLKAGLAVSSAVTTSVNTKLKRTIDTLPDNVYHWNVLANDTMLNYSFRENKIHSFLSWNKKLSNRASLQAGINIDYYMLDYQDSVQDVYGPDSLQPWRIQWAANDAWAVVQPFVSYKNRLTDQLTLTAGLTSLWASVNNNSFSPIEPRLGFLYQANETDKFFIGTGLHSQIQSPYLYYYSLTTVNGDPQEHNTEIGLTKSWHIAGGWDRKYQGPFRTKAEVYYQNLWDIPVEQFKMNPASGMRDLGSSFSMVNAGTGFGRLWPDTLMNQGIGRNYGLELTMERYFSGGFYFLTTGSLFEAKYQGSDGVWRNTTFNGRYALNTIAAKEFKVGKNASFNIGTKFTTIGGRWFGPVDHVESEKTLEVQYLSATANTQQYRAYKRFDLKLGYNWNYPKTSWEFALDLSNLTGEKNILQLTYVADHPSGNPVQEEYQLGLFPVFYLKCDF